jgi:hypothetical protein
MKIPHFGTFQKNKFAHSVAQVCNLRGYSQKLANRIYIKNSRVLGALPQVTNLRYRSRVLVHETLCSILLEGSLSRERRLR